MSKTSVMEFVKKYTMILVLILVTAFFAWQTDGKILLPQNINNLIAQNAYVFVLATGMLLCILTGGNIDLSVGSVVCFVGAVGATMMETYEMNMWVSILVMLLVGLVIGAWQGFWIAFVRIPPFITTLSGMLVFRGLSNVVLNGMTVSITNQTFIRIFGGGADCYVPDFFGGNGFNITCMLAGVIACVIYALLTFRGYFARKKKGYETGSFNAMLAKVVVLCAVLLWFTYNLSLHKGIPAALIWVIIVVLIYGYITSMTTTGRYFYAVGGNEKATKLSGINTDKVYFIAYTNMGLLAALAGMLTIARMTSAQPTYGQNYEMDAIGSCFIGGASAYGGIGTVPGVIVGAVLMGVINLGMSIMGVDANYQRVVKGLVLLAAVIFDVVSKRKNQ
ncbi:MAG TPA: sugar ABC transporter permease [Candidatus Merdisoma faecalis]|uniref:multiple monosaccharide ABC transporter permease n=1 Tax=Lachnoclostridium sp. An138 TaxID=1965560 RepID=UPI000B387294|nr:multiple monosaccharide ABC transporter permease [Lachnoclostridium sp. An138]OUQ17539.1 ABC transporter permease [Lachnoclostridium sp. An138]HIR98729.1 sugar ABC transporter permease [Candidatus Merdisoma faecalis]